MNNIDKLKDGGILKEDTELTPAEEAVVESLTEGEIDVAIETHEAPMEVFEVLFPAAGIGAHHVVGTPDEGN